MSPSTDQNTLNDAAQALQELAYLHQNFLGPIQTGTGGDSTDNPATRVVRRPWLEEPDGALPFGPPNVIPLPPVAAFPGDPAAQAIVVSFLCPNGMDGVINAISVNFAGGGFNQGSGDIVFQIRRNTAPIQNYNNILVELGSFQVPRPISPIRVYSNETIDILVIHASNGALNGPISGCLQGYFYPNKA